MAKFIHPFEQISFLHAHNNDKLFIYEMLGLCAISRHNSLLLSLMVSGVWSLDKIEMEKMKCGGNVFTL